MVDMETPSLPEGHYFLVYPHREYYCVAVIRRRRWWFDKYVLDTGRAVYIGGSEEKTRELLRSVMQSLADKVNTRDFSGSYPPNKL